MQLTKIVDAEKIIGVQHGNLMQYLAEYYEDYLEEFDCEVTAYGIRRRNLSSSQEDGST